jgi:hypothetical protein
MKKLKNAMAISLCVGLLVSATVTASAATPYAGGRQCLECNGGTVTKTTSTRYEHDERLPCKHMDEGYDLYGAYEITVRERCDNCDYESTYTYHDHIFQSCHGHN